MSFGDEQRSIIWGQTQTLLGCQGMAAWDVSSLPIAYKTSIWLEAIVLWNEITWAGAAQTYTASLSKDGHPRYLPYLVE